MCVLAALALPFPLCIRPGFSQASAVDTILERPSFLLEELLDEDDLIQECKALNIKLLA